MGEWWNNDIGDNMLAGVEGSTDNPVRLPSDYILNFLQKIPEARKSFDRMIGNMLPEEQDRLRPLRTTAEYTQIVDPVITSDIFQSNWNTEGIFTTGYRGANRAGGNR